MTITTNATVPALGSGLLTRLRNLGREPASSIEELRRIAAAQASVLKEALSGPVHQLPAYITTLIPSVIVEYVAQLPVAGLAYWADRHWHIHVRKEDPADAQILTVLYQLKRIIDHPLGQRLHTLTEEERNELAEYFARQVVTIESASVEVRGREEVYEG